MIDKNIRNNFINIFPNQIKDEFLFSFDSYQLFLERLSINPYRFLEDWTDFDRQKITERYWKLETKLDWKWSLSFPIFSLLENIIDNFNTPKIIGISGLPGSGKSTLGEWINKVARDLSIDIKVISLDDFYLPGEEMDIAMLGNPWNVPRGFPGSHSLELLTNSLDTFLNTGFFKSPIFDKSLRDGKGDRSGWSKAKPIVLILEGWFVGCEPIPDLINLDNLNDNEKSLSLTSYEREYRIIIQNSLIEYSKIWKKLYKIIHIKSNRFNNTKLWKTQQEDEMFKLKGSSLRGNKLKDFIRMIQVSIPQASLSNINSDTTIEINKLRKIERIYSNQYIF